jgi:transketolase
MTNIDKILDEAKAGVMPFESWEMLTGETSAAFAAFCVYRDYGLERNIRKAVDRIETDEKVRGKRYRVWRNWSKTYRWRERTADYDRYTEKMKEAERRKTIEAQGEMHRKVTGKMLEAVNKKLDLMNPADLSSSAVTEWVQTAIKAEREAAGLALDTGKQETKQGELLFTAEFNGL